MHRANLPPRFVQFDELSRVEANVRRGLKRLGDDQAAERVERRKMQDGLAAEQAKRRKLEAKLAALNEAIQAQQQRLEAQQQCLDDLKASIQRGSSQDRQARFPTGSYVVNGEKLDDMSPEAVIRLYDACAPKINAAGKKHAKIHPNHLDDTFMADVADRWDRVPRQPDTRKTPKWSVFETYCDKRRGAPA